MDMSCSSFHQCEMYKYINGTCDNDKQTEGYSRNPCSSVNRINAFECHVVPLTLELTGTDPRSGLASD